MPTIEDKDMPLPASAFLIVWWDTLASSAISRRLQPLSARSRFKVSVLTLPMITNFKGLTGKVKKNRQT